MQSTSQRVCNSRTCVMAEASCGICLGSAGPLASSGGWDAMDAAASTGAFGYISVTTCRHSVLGCIRPADCYSHWFNELACLHRQTPINLHDAKASPWQRTHQRAGSLSSSASPVCPSRLAACSSPSCLNTTDTVKLCGRPTASHPATLSTAPPRPQCLPPEQSPHLRPRPLLRPLGLWQQRPGEASFPDHPGACPAPWAPPPAARPGLGQPRGNPPAPAAAGPPRRCMPGALPLQRARRPVRGACSGPPRLRGRCPCAAGSRSTPHGRELSPGIPGLQCWGLQIAGVAVRGEPGRAGAARGTAEARGQSVDLCVCVECVDTPLWDLHTLWFASPSLA